MSTSKDVQKGIDNVHTAEGPHQPHTKAALELNAEQRWLERGIWARKTARVADLNGIDADTEVEQIELAPADVELLHFTMPTLDAQLNKPGSSLTGMSIMEEIQSDRMHGKLRPYTKVEPIGAYERREPNSPARPVNTDPNNQAELNRKEMLVLRAANDRAMERVLNA